MKSCTELGKDSVKICKTPEVLHTVIEQGFFFLCIFDKEEQTGGAALFSGWDAPNTAKHLKSLLLGVTNSNPGKMNGLQAKAVGNKTDITKLKELFANSIVSLEVARQVSEDSSTELYFYSDTGRLRIRETSIGLRGGTPPLKKHEPSLPS